MCIFMVTFLLCILAKNLHAAHLQIQHYTSCCNINSSHFTSLILSSHLCWNFWHKHAEHILPQNVSYALEDVNILNKTHRNRLCLCINQLMFRYNKNLKMFKFYTSNVPCSQKKLREKHPSNFPLGKVSILKYRDHVQLRIKSIKKQKDQMTSN